jgi:hypothetical protein
MRRPPEIALRRAAFEPTGRARSPVGGPRRCWYDTPPIGRGQARRGRRPWLFTHCGGPQRAPRKSSLLRAVFGVAKAHLDIRRDCDNRRRIKRFVTFGGWSTIYGVWAWPNVRNAPFSKTELRRACRWAIPSVKPALDGRIARPPLRRDRAFDDQSMYRPLG